MEKTKMKKAKVKAKAKVQAKGQTKAQAKAKTQLRVKLRRKMKTKRMMGFHFSLYPSMGKKIRLNSLLADVVHMGARIKSGNIKLGDRKVYTSLGVSALGVAMITAAYYGMKTHEIASEAMNQMNQMSQMDQMSQMETQGDETAENGSSMESEDQLDDSGSHRGLEAEFKMASSMNLQDRIDFWSNYIEKNRKGRKMLVSMAKHMSNVISGERAIASVSGTRMLKDIVPIVPSRYDCTTFVETVAALSRSNHPDEFMKNIMEIRYLKGIPTFEKRNHFPEANWIPNNEKAGIIKDITAQIAEKGGLEFKIEKKEIDRRGWLEDQFKHHAVPSELYTKVEKEWTDPIPAQVSYIDISHIKDVMMLIPSGTVLNLVHKNDGRHPVLITHQGFVIRDGNRVLLRHASRRGHIRTNELYSYLQGLLSQQKEDTSWPLIGINLDQINFSASDSNRLSASM